MTGHFTIGYDAKRIVSNGTGLGSYGRTLVNDIATQSRNLQLILYAPDKGHDELRSQVVDHDNVVFRYPTTGIPYTPKALWRSKGIIKDLMHDGVQLFHGLSGELPLGIHKSGIKSVVTIHDLIFLRHPEFYHWLDTKRSREFFLADGQPPDRKIGTADKQFFDLRAQFFSRRRELRQRQTKHMDSMSGSRHNI